MISAGLRTSRADPFPSDKLPPGRSRSASGTPRKVRLMFHGKCIDPTCQLVIVVEASFNSYVNRGVDKKADHHLLAGFAKKCQ